MSVTTAPTSYYFLNIDENLLYILVNLPSHKITNRSGAAQKAKQRLEQTLRGNKTCEGKLFPSKPSGRIILLALNVKGLTVQNREGFTNLQPIAELTTLS